MDNTIENKGTLSGRLEAVLFIFGEAMPVKKIAGVLELGEDEVKEAARVLAEELAAENRGIMLLTDGDKLGLVTKAEHAAFAGKIAKEELDAPLSPAALETLAIVAYLGPCPRSDIDYIRGVNSSFSLRNLSVRGLIEKVKRDESPAIPYYRVTGDLLRHMGVGAVEELPSFAEYREKIYATMKNEPVTPNHATDTPAD